MYECLCKIAYTTPEITYTLRETMRKSIRFATRSAIATAALLALTAPHAALYTWTQAASGFWDIDVNWSASTPTNGGDILIDIDAGSPVTVTFRDATLSAGSMSVLGNNFLLTSGSLALSGAYQQSGAGLTQIDGGTLTLNANSTIASLTLNNGKLDGTGMATIGTLRWTGGQIGTLNQGTGATTVMGSAFIDGTGVQTFYGTTLALQGQTTWSAGNGILSSYGITNIASGATFTDEGAASAAGNKSTWTGGVINNNGTFVRNGAGNTFLWAFNNSGSVFVNSGQLTLGNSTSQSGSFNIAQDTSLNLTGYVHAFTSGSTIANAGTLNVSGSTAYLETGALYSGRGGISVTDGGRLFLDQSVNTRLIQLNGGELRLKGNVTADSLIWGGSLTGGANITITGTTTIQGGSLDGTLNLNGDANWVAKRAPISGVGAGTSTLLLNIGAGTTFSDAGAYLSGDVKAIRGTLNNFGTYNRSGVGATSFAGTFTNAGTINVNAGVLSIDGNGGRSTGTVRIAQGARLEANAGQLTFEQGQLQNEGTLLVGSMMIPSVILGSQVQTSGNGTLRTTGGLFRSEAGSLLSIGTIDVGGGEARFNGTVQSNALNLSNGKVDGIGEITTGMLTWGSGNMLNSDRSGAKTVVTGSANIDGTASRLLTRRLELQGNTTWSAGDGRIDTYSSSSGLGRISVMAGSTFVDAGTSTSSSYKALGNYYFYDTIIVNGTYLRNGLGSTRIAGLTNTGQIQIQSGNVNLTGPTSNTGSIDVASGGSLTISGKLEMTDGALTNAGQTTIQANVFLSGGKITNVGTLNLNEGLVHVGGASIQNQGSMTLTGGTLNLVSGAMYSGQGRLVISTGSTLAVQFDTLSADVQANFGVIQLGDQSSLRPLSGNLINHGVLQGGGTIDVSSGEFVNNGHLAPGSQDQAATLTIKGNTRLTSSSILDIDLFAPTQVDSIAINGKLFIGGTLAIHTGSTNTFSVGDEFTIASFDALSGSAGFDAITWDSGPYNWAVSYGDHNIKLQVTSVPEPLTAYLMTIGLGGIALTRQRRGTPKA